MELVRTARTRALWTSDSAILLYLAGATLLFIVAMGGRYGFHRDELATLDDAHHLAWGYVAYPPVTPFFGRLALLTFGASVAGFRFFAALAAVTSILLTGLMARELGGGRRAQLLAAFAAMPFALGCGSLMQYVAFDCLAWVATAYFFVRLCNSEDARWWLAIGGTIGLGMLTKYSMVFCVAGIAVGVVVTRLRRHLTGKWLWLGAGCALLIFLPNLLWQWRHDFISLEFLQHIHARDVRIGRTKDFIPDQLKMELFGLPLALAGLLFLFLSPKAGRWRALPWLYVVPFVLFLLAHGRGYYLAPAYAVLFAAGAVWMEDMFRRWRPRWSRTGYAIAAVLLLADVALVSAVVLPAGPVGSASWNFAVKQNEDLAEEVGWPELVETIARVRDSLPQSDRARLGILAGNYGEAGAINLYGPAHGLPRAICGTNSFWERGYGDPPPETVIVVGFDREFVEHHFESAEVVARVTNRHGVANEETTQRPEIFLCRGLRGGWAEFWKTFQRFG